MTEIIITHEEDGRQEILHLPQGITGIKVNQVEWCPRPSGDTYISMKTEKKVTAWAVDGAITRFEIDGREWRPEPTEPEKLKVGDYVEAIRAFGGREVGECGKVVNMTESAFVGVEFLTYQKCSGEFFLIPYGHYQVFPKTPQGYSEYLKKI